MQKYKKNLKRKYSLLFLVSVLLIFICFIIFFLQLTSGEKSILSSTAPTPTPSPIILPHGTVIEIAYQPQPLQILIVEIKKEDTLTLLPNFKEKEFGSKIAEEHACDVAINGGFYKGDFTPLGLFMTEGTYLGTMTKSNVANGFFWQKQGTIKTIGKEPPEILENFDFIFQSGPYIPVMNRRLSLIKDGRARRSLLAIDAQNRLFFISIKGKENNFTGPFLADIPLLFSKKEVQKVFPLTTILNLDGGGTSFFYSRDTERTFSLSEISPVGSVLCAKLNEFLLPPEDISATISL